MQSLAVTAAHTSCVGLVHGTVRWVYKAHYEIIQRYTKKPRVKLCKIIKAVKLCQNIGMAQPVHGGGGYG